MVVLLQAGFVALIATLISSAQCFQDMPGTLSLREDSLDDHTDLYTRNIDDFEDLETRNLKDTDFDSLLSTLSRRGAPIPTAQNTPADIQSLCSKPLPTAQDFTAFFSRSGLPSDKTLFWSGIKDSVAMEIGAKLGRITLEMMVKPNNNTPLPGCDKGMNGPNGQLWWNAASEGYGDWATGSTAVVFSEKRYGEIRAGKSLSTWVRVELPALWKKFTARLGAVVHGAYAGVKNSIAGLAQRLRGLRSGGQPTSKNPAAAAAAAAATPAPAPGPATAKDPQQQAGSVFGNIQMYICDANGGNLQLPRSYDGPVPVSGNAPNVQKTARRR